MDTKLHVDTLSVAKKLNIRRLNVDANVKANINRVRDGIDGIRARLNALRTKNIRQKREMVPSFETVKVKRLNLPKELFESEFSLVFWLHSQFYKFFLFFFQEIMVKRNGTATYKGKLTTKKLTAESIKFGGVQDPNVGTILPAEHKKLEGISRIRNLQVKTINGIDWNDFHSSLFLKDSPQPIEGMSIVLIIGAFNILFSFDFQFFILQEI